MSIPWRVFVAFLVLIAVSASLAFVTTRKADDAADTANSNRARITATDQNATTAKRRADVAAETGDVAKRRADKAAAATKRLIIRTRTIERVIIRKGIGKRGKDGLVGGDGPIGKTGPQGEKGVDGKDGSSLTMADLAAYCDAHNHCTPEAVPGPKGDLGLNGVDGAQGPQGEPGTTTTIFVFCTAPGVPDPRCP